MKICAIDAFPIRLPRDLSTARGTAGSPTTLTGTGHYRWSSDYPVLYSVNFETALIRVELENGLVGWGEAQAPLAPEVPCTIVQHLLKPALEGLTFNGSTPEITALWERMYATMRVRGHGGGFMVDAMSGVDLALWDLAGKIHQKPVSQLLANSPKTRVPAYLSGTSGTTPQARADFAKRFFEEGISLVKLYFESDWNDLLAIADHLPSPMRFAVDALWHLPPDRAVPLARELDSRHARWLECPLYPEETEAHAQLAKAIQTPIAVGESYRMLREFLPFFPIARILQPDLGRSGITGSMAVANAFHSGEVIPHLSIAMGPQIAAALHFAAAAPNCPMCEFNPNVLQMANAFLRTPLTRQGPDYLIPQTPGLGLEWNDQLQSLCGIPV